MKSQLMSAVAALLCIQAVYSDVMPVQDFDLERMAGKWYMIAMASNARWFVDHRGNMKMGTSVMLPTAGGDLDITHATLNDDGSCWRMAHQTKKTDTPGQFTFHSQEWHNDNDMRIVDVQYNDYAVIHTIKTKNGVSEVLNKLFSRTPEASEVLQQRFQKFSIDTGILPDNIVILPQNAECPEA